MVPGDRNAKYLSQDLTFPPLDSEPVVTYAVREGPSAPAPSTEEAGARWLPISRVRSTFCEFSKRGCRLDAFRHELIHELAQAYRGGVQRIGSSNNTLSLRACPQHAIVCLWLTFK